MSYGPLREDPVYSYRIDHRHGWRIIVDGVREADQTFDRLASAMAAPKHALTFTGKKYRVRCVQG